MSLLMQLGGKFSAAVKRKKSPRKYESVDEHDEKIPGVADQTIDYLNRCSTSNETLRTGDAVTSNGATTTTNDQNPDTTPKVKTKKTNKKRGKTSSASVKSTRRNSNDVNKSNTKTITFDPQLSQSQPASKFGRSPTFGGSCTIEGMLTPSQIRQLKSTWKHINSNGGVQVMERIFQKLIDQHKPIKDVFYKAAFINLFSNMNPTITTVNDHAKLLVKLLDDLIMNLDKRDPNRMQVVTCAGAHHAFLKQSGFKPEIWELFGENGVEIIGTLDCVKSNVDAMRAWTVLMACMTDEMRHGFETQCKVTTKEVQQGKSATAMPAPEASTVASTVASAVTSTVASSSTDGHQPTDGDHGEIRRLSRELVQCKIKVHKSEPVINKNNEVKQYANNNSGGNIATTAQAQDTQGQDSQPQVGQTTLSVPNVCRNEWIV